MNQVLILALIGQAAVEVWHSDRGARCRGVRGGGGGAGGEDGCGDAGGV